MKLGFLGAGNMGSAIARRCADNTDIGSADIFIFDVDKQKSESVSKGTGIGICSDEKELINKCDVVVLAVKPQIMPDLIASVKDTIKSSAPLIVSIAAGKTTRSIEDMIGSSPKVGRIFPNLNAAVGQAISAYCVGRFADKDDKSIIAKIARSIGVAIDYPEDMFPVFGVLGGCAPAYTFMFIKSLADAAAAAGMDTHTAMTAAIQTVYGSAAYIGACGLDADELINRVCSKGGTTIEGVNSLRRDDLPTIVKKAFDASLARDHELSKV